MLFNFKVKSLLRKSLQTRPCWEFYAAIPLVYGPRTCSGTNQVPRNGSKNGHGSVTIHRNRRESRVQPMNRGSRNLYVLVEFSALEIATKDIRGRCILQPEDIKSILRKASLAIASWMVGSIIRSSCVLPYDSV